MNVKVSFSLSKMLADFRLRQQLAKCRLVRCTGKLPEELQELKESLGLRYSDMLIFYNELGFLPSPGYSISIRHFGVEEVVEGIRENLAQKTVKTVTV